MKLTISRDFNNFNNKVRLKSLFLLLFRSDNYVTSNQLAERLNVTSRTIKSDIKELRKCIESIGKIESKRGHGYQLDIFSDDLTESVKDLFQMYPSSKVSSDLEEKALYILRRFISSDKPIKIEDLQEELITTGDLDIEIKRVRNILDMYDLELEYKPHYGSFIVGEEYKKIMLTIRAYRYFGLEQESNFGIRDFFNLFRCSSDDRETMKETFFQIIIHSRVVFSDIEVERFIECLNYFRNKILSDKKYSITLPEINFNYQGTDEYRIVKKIVQELNQELSGFDFPKEIVRFLTYIAIFSTDLYRYSDCTNENYHELVPFSNEMRHFILSKASYYLKIDVFEDYTCYKDLLKLLIPISLKVKLGVSDSIDMRHKDSLGNSEQIVLKYFTKKIGKNFYEEYNYQFSKIESHILYLTLYGMINRITLENKKLKIALIAINGRLSTQQIKFNLLHHFSEYIDRIETKNLYELEIETDEKYNYYLCSSYYKHLIIDKQPIYYVKEEISETEYIEEFKSIFFEVFMYDERLPNIKFHKFNDNLDTEANEYDYIIPLRGRNNITIKLMLKLSVREENFEIIERSLEEYLIKVKVDIDGDQKKLKMILNVIDKITNNQIILNELGDKKEEIKYVDVFSD